MESFRIIGPRPRPDALHRIQRDDERLEQGARRHAERAMETRRRATACPACGFGGYDGYCIGCTYGVNSQPVRIENRSSAATPPRAPRPRCGHCGGNPPNCCATMYMNAGR
jgi:hypothetical protein